MLDQKPSGVQLRHFQLNYASYLSSEISQYVRSDIKSLSKAAFISYSEALNGVRKGCASWAIIKLYYCAFYAVKALLLDVNVVTFSNKGEFCANVDTGDVRKGGRSSHIYNWNALRDLSASSPWFLSEDTEAVYTELRSLRERAAYNRYFSDPNFPGEISGFKAEKEARMI
ncbi:hypothetical protein [Maritimibacter alexandrii]|uniref:hypothetical protein n=1 Tax=Maritimibacter alexandrii TaxID=2570355 RepID=UPI001108F75E|nr:hypothetical protein [Maritimibacter alexandrii]